MYECEEACELVGFEGPEKRLSIDFKLNKDPLGLRALTRTQINEVLDLARCTIVSQTSNDFFDSYVLSESSLFIYPNKFLIKTCGTTTLLRCIPRLMELASALDLTIELVAYSRKNYLFPHRQQYPHLHWNDEVDFLNKIFDGASYVFGPLSQSRWYLYLADYSGGVDHHKPYTMEVMMHELASKAAQKFYRREGISDNEKMPGVAELIPGSTTDEFNFTPCGYSMNGLYNSSYYTIHVTPEPHCSYASFETNLNLSSFRGLMPAIMELFQPGSFTLAIYRESVLAKSLTPLSGLNLEIPGYVVTHKNSSEMEGTEVLMCNFKAANLVVPIKKNPPTAPVLHLNGEP